MAPPPTPEELATAPTCERRKLQPGIGRCLEIMLRKAYGHQGYDTRPVNIT
jgi:hypothetical protein